MINLWASSVARGPDKEKLVRRSQKNESEKTALILTNDFNMLPTQRNIWLDGSDLGRFHLELDVAAAANVVQHKLRMYVLPLLEIGTRANG